MSPLSLLRMALLSCVLGGAMLPAGAASPRSVIAVSDLHVGAGADTAGKWNPIEDFRWDADFSAFLDHVSATHGDQIDLVLVGDVFELWQSPTMSCSGDPTHPGCQVKDCISGARDLSCSEADAVARLKHVVGRHPQFFALLKRFAGKGDNRIYIVPGNHDAALMFPQVSELLRDNFAGLRVYVQTSGYWLSEDGRVYADHGHQFDYLNKFSNWPTPFKTRNGVRYISKPWGENMVKEFYEQYEYIFPIVDNLGSDLEGIKYGLAHASKLQSGVAVAKLLQFLIVEQSFTHRLDLLGDDYLPASAAEWDYAAVRAKPAAFFVESLDDPEAREIARSIMPSAAAFDGDVLGDGEIDQICRKKSQLNGPASTHDKVEACPLKGGGNLGQMLFGENKDHSAMRPYLAGALETAAVAAGRPALANLYIYGHTHKAEAQGETLNLGETNFGTHGVKFVNTGAFQRVATLDKVNQLEAVPRAPAVLNPEDLPACYTYVLVAPYEGTPVSQLRTWSRSGNQPWSSAPGVCLNY